MIKVANILRYLLAIVLPVVCVFIDSLLGLCVALIILYCNNALDDIAFYYGSAIVDSKYKGGIPSPVNGIVTKVEKGVPLYSHLIKSDVLTNEELIKVGVPIKKRGKYNHITIFLNKLNKHIVAKMMSGGVSQTYKFDEKNEEMVECGELIANNKGRYLRNTFVEITYKNGVKAIVTMDKYISEAIVYLNSSIEMLICRGSQCDIYLPEKYDIAVKEHQKVEIYDALSMSANEYDGVASKEDLYRDANFCIEFGGITYKKIFKENAKKTLKTFTYCFPLFCLCFLIDCFWITPMFLAVFMYIYLFLLNRSVKNLLYSIMNVFGYKMWMTKVYKVINIMTNYG